MGKLSIGQNVREVIEADLQLESKAIPDLKAAIIDCEEAQDYVTRSLLNDILNSEEGHLDYLKTQLRMIENQGLENYVQLQSKPLGDD